MRSLGSAVLDALGPDVRDEFPGVPDVERVVAPASVDEAAQVLRTASRHGLRTVIWGGGTHQGMGYPMEPDVIVLTAALTQVVDWQSEDLTIVVEAGMPVDRLEEMLGEAGQSAVLPEIPGAATVGGVISAGVSGWRRLRYGPSRDRVLEVVMATGDGRVVTGGGRVVKNVTGYDLPRLVAGSLGSLGFVATVCLKLWPLATASATIAVTDAAAARRTAFRPLAVIETEETAAVYVAGTEAEVEGQAADLDGDVTPGLVWPQPLDAAWRLSLRVPPALVPDAVARVRRLDRAASFRAAHGVGEVRIGVDEFDADAAHRLRTWAEGVQGSLIVCAAPSDGGAVDPWGTPPVSLALQRKVKAAFDPMGILNPGRLPGRL